MAKGNLLNAKNTIHEIEDAWRSHNEALNLNISNLEKIESSYSKMKLPSQFTNAIQTASTGQDRLTESTEKLNRAARTTQKLLQSEIVDRRNMRAQTQLLYKSNTDLWGAYSRLSAQTAIYSQKVQDLIARGKTATQTQKQFNAEVKEANRIFQIYQSKVLAADRAVGKWGRTMERSFGFLKELVSAFGIATGVALFASIAKSWYDISKAIQTTDAALRLVTGSQEDFIKNQAFLNLIAEKYGLEIQGLTTQFTQFWVVAKDRLAGNEIRAIFEEVSKAGASLGLSTESQERAFLALNQMMSKGTLQAEELRGQLGEALPGAYDIMVKAYQKLHPEEKITTQSFAKLMKDGKVLASEVLPEFARQLALTYGTDTISRIETMTAKENRLANEYRELIRSVNEGSGPVSQFFSMFIDGSIGAVAALTRLNKSWKQLFSEAESAGTVSGESLYTKMAQSLIGTGNEKEVAQSIKASQEHLLAIYEKNQIELQKKAQQANAKVSGSLMNPLNWNPVSYYNRAKKSSANQDLEESKRRIAELKSIIDEANKVISGVKKTPTIAPVVTKEQIAAIERLTRALAELEQQMKKIQHEREISDLEREKYLLEQRYANEKDYLDSRIELMTMARDKELAINASNYLEEVRLAEEALQEEKRRRINLAKNKYIDAKTQAAAISKIELWYNEMSLDNKQIAADKFRSKNEKDEKASEEAILELKKKAFDDFLEYRAKNGRPTDAPGLPVNGVAGNEDQLGGANFLPSDQMGALTDEWKDKMKERQKAIEEYLKNLKDKTHAFLTDIQKDFFSQAGFESFNVFIKDNFNEITGKWESTYEQLMKGADTTLKKFQVNFAVITSVVNDAFAFINQAGQANFEARYAQLDKEKEVALAFAGESAAGRENIERLYDEKRRRIQNEEARAQKKAALFKAITGTATAVVAALPNIPLSILVGLIGAAQIAMIAGQQVPQYWKGTENAPGGLAWTQEKGAEIITDKNNKVKTLGSHNGPQLTKLDKGDKVKTAAQTRKMLFDAEYSKLLSFNGILPAENERNYEILNNMLTEAGVERAFERVMSRQSENEPSFQIVQSERGTEIYETRKSLRKKLLSGELRLKTRRLP